jgi:cytochrome c oxidase subunit 2
MRAFPFVLAQTRLDTRVPSYMRPAGAPANVEATLGWWLTAVAILVVIIISALVIAAIARHRGEASPNTGTAREQVADKGATRWKLVSGLQWIYVGVGITVVILLVSYGGTLATLAEAARPDRKAPLTLDVVAHQWWWEMRTEDSVPSDAFVTANEVHIPVGVPVHLRVQSYDVIHSFWIPELGGKIDVIPGQVNEAWLRADHAGVYRGQCAEYCGLQHARMALAIIADPPAEYARWAAAQRAPATPIAPANDSTGIVAPGAQGVAPGTVITPLTTPAPQNRGAGAGEATFVAYCGGCHTVRGTDALGVVGPDLTHVASRLTIGAGMLDNTPENLTRWVRDPQSVKQGVLMPRMDLREQQLASVVAYLETLH